MSDKQLWIKFNQLVFKYICILIVEDNLNIITIKYWKLKWRGVWGGSWSFHLGWWKKVWWRGWKVGPWSWNWLQQSSSFMGRAIPTIAMIAIVFIFIINSSKSRLIAILRFNIEALLYIILHFQLAKIK